MASEIETTINEILHKAVDAAASTGDFLKGQIPDICKELINYTIAMDIICIILPIVAIFFCYKAVFKWTDQRCDSHGYWETDKCAAVFVSAVILMIGIPTFIVSLCELIKVIFAPKIFLLEYAAQLIK